MRLVALKGIDGKLEFKDMPQADLVDWFKSNIDDEGNVTDEIILYNHGIIVFSKEEKADNEGIPFTLSTFDLDRDSERIDQTGWDLKNFKANPVVLWSHEWWTPAIGKINSVRIKDGNLKGKALFVQKEIDQLGWSIGEKVKTGFLSTGSVGFKPKKIEIVEDEKDPTRVIHRKQELYEFSIVNLPSNTSARVERSVESIVDNDGILTMRNGVAVIDTTGTSTDKYDILTSRIDELDLKYLALSKRNKNYIAAAMQDLPRETSVEKGRAISDLLKNPNTVEIQNIFNTGE